MAGPPDGYASTMTTRIMTLDLSFGFLEFDNKRFSISTSFHIDSVNLDFTQHLQYLTSQTEVNQRSLMSCLIDPTSLWMYPPSETLAFFLVLATSTFTSPRVTVQVYLEIKKFVDYRLNGDWSRITSIAFIKSRCPPAVVEPIIPEAKPVFLIRDSLMGFPDVPNTPVRRAEETSTKSEDYQSLLARFSELEARFTELERRTSQPKLEEAPLNPEVIEISITEGSSEQNNEEELVCDLVTTKPDSHRRFPHRGIRHCDKLSVRIESRSRRNSIQTYSLGRDCKLYALPESGHEQITLLSQAYARRGCGTSDDDELTFKPFDRGKGVHSAPAKRAKRCMEISWETPVGAILLVRLTSRP